MLESIKVIFDGNYKVMVDLAYNIVLAITIIMLSFFTSKLLHKAITKAHEKYNKLDITLAPILRTSSSYLVYTIGIVFILDIFGVNTTSIIALLGAAGLAIGFALKDTLSNIAAGIMLLFLRPFRSGDFVEFDSTMGTIREINLFNTILETFDGLYVSSPNNVIWTSNIKNYTRNGKRRMDIVVGISYGDIIDEGLKVLQQIGRSEPRLLKEPAPQAMVKSLADSSVNIQLRAWTTIDDYWETLWDMNKRVKEEIEKAGLTIPFPQQDVHIITK